MKKLIITVAIILSVGTTSLYAQQGGLFDRGSGDETDINGANSSLYSNGNNSLIGRDGEITPILPGNHGNLNDQPAPLGGGVLLLIGMGAAYAVCRKRKGE